MTGAEGFWSMAAAAADASPADRCSSDMEIDAKEPAGNVVPVSMLLQTKYKRDLSRCKEEIK
jgi:hypothetical protein